MLCLYSQDRDWNICLTTSNQRCTEGANRGTKQEKEIKVIRLLKQNRELRNKPTLK